MLLFSLLGETANALKRYAELLRGSFVASAVLVAVTCLHDRRSYVHLSNEVFQMSDATLREYQEELGEDFGTVYYGVCNDWSDGVVRLKEYRVLFGDPAAVQLLNAISGGGFMWDVQQVLWRDLLLHVTRLTDPVETAGHQNLTVRRLPAFCESPELRARLQAIVNTSVGTAEFARDWRNRLISHSDLCLAIDPDAESLAPATLRRVQDALDAVHSALATVSRALLDQDLANDVLVSPRAAAFLAYARQLSGAVKYVDSLVDPGGNAPITARDLAEAFLRKHDRPLTWREFRHVIDLREAARRFE